MPLVLVQPGVIKKNSAEYFAGTSSQKKKFYFKYENKNIVVVIFNLLVVLSRDKQFQRSKHLLSLSHTHSNPYTLKLKHTKQYAVSEVSSRAD